MRSILLFLFFGTYISTSGKWMRFETKCFQINIQFVNQNKAKGLCQQRDAVLISTSVRKELEFIKRFLSIRYVYWVLSSHQNGDNQGKRCCTRNRMGRNLPGTTNTCMALQKNGKLIDRTCNNLNPFICSKVFGWTLVKSTDYYFDDLCGVEIMANCKGLPCEDVCNSHHDCKQFAKMQNLCINIQNDSKTDQCVIKLRPNLELYQKNC